MNAQIAPRVGPYIALFGLGLVLWSLGGLVDYTYLQGTGSGLMIGVSLYHLILSLSR